jgi:hypothetical protein
MTVLSRDPEIT